MSEERLFSMEIPIRSRDSRHRDGVLATATAKVEEPAAAPAAAPAAPAQSPFEQHFRLSRPPQRQQQKQQQLQTRCPEGLNIIAGAAANKTYRDRSPTTSTMSSIHAPDSATTCSMPMSPMSLMSSIFTRATTPDIDGFERLPTPFQATRPGAGGGCGHRYRESCDSGSTFVDSINEERIPAHPDAGGGGGGGLGLKEEMSPRMDSREPENDEPTPNDAPHITGTPRPLLPENETPESPVEKSTPGRPLNGRMSFDSGSDRLSRAWEPPSPTPVDFSNHEADAVLDYVLQMSYGVDLDEITMPPVLLRQFAFRFIQDVGRVAFGGFPVTQLTHTTSTSSNGSMPFGSGSRSGSGQGSQNGKRKKGNAGRADGGGGDDGDDLTDDDGDMNMPLKRARPSPREADENLRLSCPFRKRNPRRFNVREHHSCAMTYFPKFAELRQHIVKQHKRNDPSAFICDRCNRDFPGKKDLRDHQRLPKERMCDVADHDPESGIDGPTMTKLLSRKRASGMSPEVQWKEIWHLLFPDDDDYSVKPFDFCPVIEHFELQSQFLNSLKTVEGNLRNKGVNEQALETIGNIYRNQFIQVIEQCVANARMMPYSNRSNRKNEPSPSRLLVPRQMARSVPRPDSGVDVDEGSEDSQSVAVFPGGGIGGIGGIGGGGFDGQGMLSHSDGLRTVRRVSSTSTEFRSSLPPRTLQPLMEQMATPDFGIGAESLTHDGSPPQHQHHQQQQQQHMLQMLQHPDQTAGFMPMVNGMAPEMTAQLWGYRHSSHAASTSSPGQPDMFATMVPGTGQGQDQFWNSPLPDHNGLYEFSGYNVPH